MTTEIGYPFLAVLTLVLLGISLERILRRAELVAVLTGAACFAAACATRGLATKLDLIGNLGSAIIGTLERWISFALVVNGEYQALGFVLAAKALARHADLEKPPFAEYFLIGTLASVALSIAAGETFLLLSL